MSSILGIVMALNGLIFTIIGDYVAAACFWIASAIFYTSKEK